jgi:molybdopterin synthase sulfur carrier subunit
MQAHFFATLRPIVGGKTVDFDVDHGVTVQEMLDLMIARVPKLRDELLDETGQMHGHVHFFVNGVTPNSWPTVLKPASCLTMW